MNRQLARINLLNAVRLVVAAMKFYSGQDLESIEGEYNTTLYSAMDDYFSSDRPITAFRNEFRRAVNDAFTMTVFAGWSDAGGSGPIPDDLQSWLNNRIEEEIGYADELFDTMADMRKNDTDPSDIANYIQQRADGYTNALIGIYSYSEMIAMQERPGQWVFGDTVDHCSTCSELNGKIHPLNWYLDNGYIPQEAGSDTLECHGYYCQCSIIDPKTGEQLIP